MAFSHDISKEKEKIIINMYLDRFSIKDITKKTNIGRWKIKQIISKNNIKKPLCKKFSQSEIEDIIKLWDDGYSMYKISKKYKCIGNTIKSLLIKLDIKPNARFVNMKNHPRWRGGKLMRKGYFIIKLEKDNEFYSMCDSKGYVFEHRLAMAQSLKRCLNKKESVHHIDGNKLNNSLDNLQLRHSSHGPGSVFVCKVCNSSNILNEKIQDIGNSVKLNDCFKAKRKIKSIGVKKTRINNGEGYYLVRVDYNDPMYCMSNNHGYVLEHRLVMARFLNRALNKHETVHHIDGDRGNNEISNLQIRIGNHGSGLVKKCIECGSINIAAKEIL